ncbi:phage minor head protein [Brachybacterium hainanense]|uniref:Phage minor head protein n=1 Tax=Brachybacterium hainanense TaxID=1541174 RepID=A0ABV6R972_9MICO
MTITQRVIDIETAMQTILDTHLDDHTRTLTTAWVRAWEDTRAELEAAVLGKVAPGNVSMADPIDPRRLDRALDSLAQSLGELVDLSDETIRASVADIVRLGVDGETAMIGTQLPDGAVPLRADAGQITAMIARSTEQITAAHLPISADADAAMRRRLVRGITVGDNPRLVADQIMADVHQDFNGGLARALNISRTEMLDAMRQGQKAADARNQAVLGGWVWGAHLDSKTCRSCIAMHGTEHTIDEEGPIDHHSGRCARIPKTKTWAELGFPGIEEPPPALPDAETWFEGLTEQEQRRLLTSSGYEAWKRGDYSISDWAARKSNGSWRDSMVPSTPPKEA